MRTLPLTNTRGQDMVALDDLASAFQLNVRDDGGAITVAYKGRRVVLTPDQTIASVAGRLISLPAPPVRSGNRWLVPLEFISRALASIYDAKLDLRRTSRLLLVGDLRVPRVAVRQDSQAASATVTFDISPAVNPSIAQQGTARLLVHFDADALELELPAGPGNGFVESVRASDATTVAIDLGPRFSTFRSTSQPIDDGLRVTIDAVGAQTEATPAPTAAPAPVDVPVRELALDTGGIRTIAIDAGHGGDDNGAASVDGVLEKDVTLAVARRLKAALEARLGVRVLMTRDDDRRLPAESRTALANNNKADLFISLHANASFRPATAGATVYTATFDDAELARERLGGERMPVVGGGMRTIDVVPWSLAQVPHREQSDLFARTLAAALGERVPVSPKGVDGAPLRVLESANMPAVLVEMGYLTNADQAKALGGSEFQTAVSQALIEGVIRFRDGVLPPAPPPPPAPAPAGGDR